MAHVSGPHERRRVQLPLVNKERYTKAMGWTRDMATCWEDRLVVGNGHFNSSVWLQKLFTSRSGSMGESPLYELSGQTFLQWLPCCACQARQSPSKQRRSPTVMPSETPMYDLKAISLTLVGHNHQGASAHSLAPARHLVAARLPVSERPAQPAWWMVAATPGPTCGVV
jgi:hypothetical protein